MTSRLSTDTIQQLTPLLGSLARLVARGSQLSDEELHILLLGSDLEPEPVIVEELKRWGKLLTALRQQPSEGLRHATVEALLLRGLPEAPVLLAVATVAEGAPTPTVPSVSSQARELTASVTSLDFGILQPGQHATGEFEVHGGPGQIVVESDQLQVTPQHFGAEPTSIRVEVKPLAGGVLWTALRLVTAGATVEVPVVAQWTDMPAEVEPSQQTADPDADLTAMIEQALGISPSARQSPASSASSPSGESDEDDEVLEQLRRLLG